MRQFSEMAKASSLLDVASGEALVSSTKPANEPADEVQVIEKLESPTVTIEYSGKINPNGKITKQSITIIDNYRNDFFVVTLPKAITPWSFKQSSIFRKAKKMIDMNTKEQAQPTTKSMDVYIANMQRPQPRHNEMSMEEMLNERPGTFREAVEAAETFFCPIRDERNFVLAVVRICNEEGIINGVSFNAAKAVAKSMQQSVADPLAMPSEPSLFLDGYIV